MPGLIYTFARDTSDQSQHASFSREPSTDAIIAVAFAATGERGVFFEELTSSDCPTPIVSVVFQDDEAMEVFERRIQTAASMQQLSITNVQPIGLGTSAARSEEKRTA
jgi:hypothetical protein